MPGLVKQTPPQEGDVYFKAPPAHCPRHPLIHWPQALGPPHLSPAATSTMPGPWQFWWPSFYSGALRGWLCPNVYDWFLWTLCLFKLGLNSIGIYWVPLGGCPVLGWHLCLATSSGPTGQVMLVHHFGWASRLLGLRLDASCSPAKYIFLVTRIPGAGNGRDLGL